MDNQANQQLHELQRIYTNLRKSPLRKYLKQTLVQHLKTSRQLYEDICYLLDDFDHPNQKIILYETRRLFGEIKTFIDIRLDGVNHLVKLKVIAEVVTTFISLYKRQNGSAESRF